MNTELSDSVRLSWIVCPSPSVLRRGESRSESTPVQGCADEMPTRLSIRVLAIHCTQIIKSKTRL
jgi:hypothetical protein